MEIPYIDTRGLARTPFEVTVIRVVSPSYFWVHLHNYKRDFKELLEAIQLRMEQRKNGLLMWPQQVKEGTICAVDVEDGTWQRGIVHKDLGGGAVLVSLRDWGTIMYRFKHHIYILEDKYQELPWQAIPCGLAYTAPSTLAPYWPKKTNTIMRILCEGKKGWMRIRGSNGEHGEEAYVDIKIKMENDGDVVYIRTLLKSFGYTRDIPELKTETQPHLPSTSQ